MFSKAVKTEKSKSQAGTTRDSDKQNPGKSNARLTADSPDAASLGAYQTMACNSQQAGQIAQMQAMANDFSAAQAEPKKENNTGLPDTLKTGIENLSGLSMDDVRVHYNSDKPAQLQALAYAQGTEIHVAPGQERHLPHEAWHVVQQMQGRVQPTRQMKGGVQVNDDAELEKEADVMGQQSLYAGEIEKTAPLPVFFIKKPYLPVNLEEQTASLTTDVVQRITVFAARQIFDKLGNAKNGVPYSKLFTLWLKRPENQKKLEAMDDAAIKTEIELMTAMGEGDIDAEMVELTFAAEKSDFLTKVKESEVFNLLVKGISPDGDPAANLSQLLANFKAVKFDYTMQSKSAVAFIEGKSIEGDCNTLVRAFEHIAKFYLGIKDVKYCTSKERGFARFCAPQKQTVGIPKTGNVNNGAFWVFENHYWIECGGEVFDVLFGLKGLDTSVWGKQVGISSEPEIFEVKADTISRESSIQVWATGESGDITKRWTTTNPKPLSSSDGAAKE